MSNPPSISSKATHPDEALFKDAPRLPIINSCDHYAGSEKLMQNALRLQGEIGPSFDVTLDCEDGAARGRELEHAALIVKLLQSPENKFNLVGVRINDITTAHWRKELDLVVRECGEMVSHITIPKSTCYEDVALVLDYLQMKCEELGSSRKIPAHVLIETHGALRDVWKIAALPGVRVLEFGLLDFISAHHGAIPISCMTSPGQFEHELIRRAKCEIVAAAIGNNVIPAHNITLAYDNPKLTSDDALRARQQFGFLRMWSIHPAQIEPIIKAMHPDFSDVKKAEAILIAAQDKDWAPIGHQQELHDRASYRFYWDLLKRAHHAGLPLSPETQKRFFAG